MKLTDDVLDEIEDRSGKVRVGDLNDYGDRFMPRAVTVGELVAEVRRLRNDKRMTDCPDCAVKPGQAHRDGCDVERCSVSGLQRLGCPCEGHDPSFARWTGFWPGSLEADALGIDLNELSTSGLYETLFVKP